MSISAATMLAGLRVLTALSDHTNPAAADVAKLRRAVPDFKDLPLEELAYKVLQFEIRARRRARAAGSI
jgi:hypothetical protein